VGLLARFRQPVVVGAAADRYVRPVRVGSRAVAGQGSRVEARVQITEALGAGADGQEEIAAGLHGKLRERDDEGRHAFDGADDMVRETGFAEIVFKREDKRDVRGEKGCERVEPPADGLD
jgi:hypothetical protein